MDASQLSADERAALDALTTDLRRIFGVRLRSLIAYGLEARRQNHSLLNTLAMVERVTFEDLAACVPSSGRWRALGLEVPLIISRDEFHRTLDIFPLEYSGILANHIVVDGTQPFEGLAVAEVDLRRACEQQARSHLIHLREGFLESGGDSRDISRLIAASAPAFRALLVNLAYLRRHPGAREPDDHEIAEDAERSLGVSAELVREVLAAPASITTIADPTALLGRYIAAAEKIWTHMDRWRRE
jgi:hypothetical protein